MSPKPKKMPAKASQSGAAVPAPVASSQFLLYPAEDGRTVIQVRMDGNTLWMSQREMADLYRVSKQNVSYHLRKIFLKMNWMRLQLSNII